MAQSKGRQKRGKTARWQSVQREAESSKKEDTGRQEGSKAEEGGKGREEKEDAILNWMR